MKSNNLFWKLLIRILLLVAAITVAVFCYFSKNYNYIFALLLLIVYQVYEMYRFQKKTHDELEQFLLSVQYRDFSRYFDISKGDSEVRFLRQGFNEINSTIKTISREKEMQYLYLQKMLELVDTGILLYREGSGEVLWMNEALKKMLDIPFLRTVHSLQKRNPALHEAILSVKAGTSQVINLSRNLSIYKVLLSTTAFQTESIYFKLVAVQNVNEALDANEVQSWQKLLSVLTHEIMNSVAPISSLADTLKKRIGMEDDGSLLNDLEQGIDTIKNRSEGLIRFTEAYRNLNKITTLLKKEVLVRDLFENVYQLLEPTLEQKGIEMEIVLKNTNQSVLADAHLMEQVLINLVLNAIEAVKDKPEPLITLSAGSEGSRTEIRVADNGTGMPEEILDKIFIPFFSTRKKGSGIGLSICKQIVLLHKGTLQVRSKAGEGTVFVISLS
ncbi:PAS domain-containing sensor histidine kinase [Leadbetterella sp. DM7]|uniref:sensor histidine kinase n=1 Tax=Leadbetterella sp. DM7 TaxID=3235085 RepID=UPI00349E4D82